MQSVFYWFDGGAGLAQIFLDAVLKATVLMLLTATAVFVLHGSSAAVRHRVWGLMFGGLLLLPVLVCALPQLRIPILPQNVMPPEAEMTSSITDAGTPPSPSEGASWKARESQLASSDEPLLEERESMHSAVAPMTSLDANGSGDGDELASVLILGPAEIPQAIDAATKREWIHIAILIWLSGAALTLLPLLLSIGRNVLLWHGASRVDDADWRTLMDELRRRLGLRRRVELLASDRPLVPMTWGLVRPVVMLPENSRSWTEGLRHFVLLHELAHIKRWDVGFQMLGRFVCAIYWFHPLAWYGLHRLRIERELACDDCVLMAGERPTDYAEQLLQIVRRYQPTGLVAAVAMAQPSTLEQRIRALLDSARSHLPLSPHFAGALLAAAISILAGVAVVTPAQQETENVSAEVTESGEAPESAAGESVSGAASTQAQPTQITVRGRVVLPDGSPAVGAVVRAAPPISTMHEAILGNNFEPPISQAMADSNGQFEISFSSQPYGDLSQFDVRWKETWKETKIAASLPDYGPQWVQYDEIEDPTKPITLNLVEDMPVEGRVIDLEGNPVGGVTVQIGGPSAAVGENLSPWIEAAKNGEDPRAMVLNNYAPRWVEPKMIGVPASVETNEDGRFTIRGIGKERLLSLVFEGDTVAYRAVSVVTRPMESFQRVISTPPFEGFEAVHGAEFVFAASPSRPIIGTVRDAETGEPLPGVAVESYKFTDYPYSNHRVLKTVSDDEGRYRLTGLPKGDGNKLLVLPNDDQPYLMRQFDVPNPSGLEPVTVDVEIHRGIWITGRITDKLTGAPVGAARIYYLPFRSNEFAQALPEFHDDGNVDGDQMRYTSKPDGTYRLVGLPGRAVVGAQSVYKQYRKGAGYDAVRGPYYENTEHLDTYRNPVNPSPKWPDVIAEINPPRDVESVILDLQMDPGLSIPIAMVDPDDRPLVDVEVTGFTSRNGTKKTAVASFDATAFAPDEIRTVLFHHKEKNLGWVERIRPSDAEKGPITIKLQPVATVTARLLHGDDSPMAGAVIKAHPLPSGDFAMRLPRVSTGTDGRFQLTLLPGAAYSLQAEGSGIDLMAEIARMLTVEPGEAKDLGDLRLTDGTFVAAKASEAEQQGKLMKLRGQVLGPDGQPHRRARVWVQAPLAAEWTLIARTDNDGRFDASVDRTRLEAALKKNSGIKTQLAATADGLGFAWVNVGVEALERDIVLDLLEDVPVEGRIVTLEGEPAEGVTIRVGFVSLQGKEKVDEYIRSAPESSGIYFNPPPSWISGDGSEIDSDITDADGRFRIAGVGAERVVRLELFGGGIGATRLAIVTRPAPSGEAKSHAIAVKEGLAESTYYTAFTHIATPGRTLRGIVTDEETGDPVEGVRVHTSGSWHSWNNPETTGADGRYEITGVPKQDEYRLSFEPTESLHFNKELRIADTAALGPISADASLPTGITVRGRVIDAESEEPLSGTVSYNPLFPNPHWSRLGETSSVANPASTSKTADDGTYEISVLPGPGVINVQLSGNDSARYISATLNADQLRKMIGDQSIETNAQGEVRFLQTAAGDQSRGIVGLHDSQSAALLNPADDVRELTIDLTAVRGRSRQGSIVDDAGIPLAGVNVIGLGPSGLTMTYEPLKTAEFTVEGLVPGRQRTLLFVHPERQVGAKIIVSGDDIEPLTVRMKPTGTVTGRFVDEVGDPVSDIGLQISPTEPLLTGTNYWIGRSDPEGRFRISGLIAHTTFRLDAKPIENSGRQPFLEQLFVMGDLRVDSGETVELGVFMQEDEYRIKRIAEASDADGAK